MNGRCERCAAEATLRVARRVWLCGECIRHALEARFPVFGLPLAALAEAERQLRLRATGS